MPGSGRRSKCSSHSPQMRLGLSPPWMQPRFSVGTSTSNSGLRWRAASSSRNASKSAMTCCMPSSALRPSAGFEECPELPGHGDRLHHHALVHAHRAQVGRLADDGVARARLASGDQHRWRRPSSSPRRRSRPGSAARAGAPHERPAPPRSRPGRSPSCRWRPGRRAARRAPSGRRGSCPRAASSKGTVSVWPASTSPPGPSPSTAIRLTLSAREGICCISQRKPSACSHSASSSQTPRLPWSHSGSVQLTDGEASRRSNIVRKSGTRRDMIRPVCNFGRRIVRLGSSIRDAGAPPHPQRA
jgi:hypothetical protein